VPGRDGATTGASNADAQATVDEPIAVLLETVGPAVIASVGDLESPGAGVTVGTPASAEALHRVRIAAKKLRYQLEVIAPYLGAAGEEAVGRVRRLQNRLGDFHDDTVLDRTLLREIRRAEDRDRSHLASELRRLRAARRRSLLRDERSVRAAIDALHESGFADLLRGALAAAGVVLTPHTAEQEKGPSGQSASGEQRQAMSVAAGSAATHNVRADHEPERLSGESHET
jgi:hypothetical protein